MHVTARAMIGFGWTTFKKAPWRLIGFSIVAGLILGVANAALNETSRLGVAVAFIVFFVNLALQTLYKMGATNFILKAEHDPALVELKDYWHPGPFWRFLGATLLVALWSLLAALVSLVLAGIAWGSVYLAVHNTTTSLTALLVVFVPLMVVLAFYISVLFFFAPYLVVAKGLAPFEALRESRRLTEGHRWMLLRLFILCFLVNVLGLICLVVGLLVSVQVSKLALVHAYRTLSSHPHPHTA